MTTGNDFVVRMLFATAQFDRAVKQSGTKSGRLADDIDRDMRRVRRSGGRAGQGMTEISRGLQDITSVMGAGGSFAQGLNGASNNFGELVTRIHPLAGLAVGAGLALGGPLLMNLLEVNNGLSESQQQINGMTQALQDLERQATSMERIAKFGFNIDKFSTSDQARSGLNSRDAEKAGLGARRKSLEEQQAELTRRFNIVGANAITRERGGERGNNAKAEERFQALDDDAKRRVIDKWLEIQAKLEDVAEASRAVTVESIALTGKLRELEEAEKKTAAETAAKKEADRMAKEKKQQADKDAREQDRRDRERRSKQQQADALLARMNPLEEWQQRADKINTLFNEGFLDKSQFADAIDELGQKTQERILKGSETQRQQSKPQFASALSFGSAEGFNAIARAVVGTDKNNPQQQTAKQTAQIAELTEEMNILLEQIKQNTKPNKEKPITIGSR